MSNKELDNLFKNKLEKIHKEPGQNAWSKISGQIDVKEKKAFPYLKVAAAVLILLTFSFSLNFFLVEEISMNQLADNSANEENLEINTNNKGANQNTTEPISNDMELSEEKNNTKTDANDYSLENSNRLKSQKYQAQKDDGKNILNKPDVSATQSPTENNSELIALATEDTNQEKNNHDATNNDEAASSSQMAELQSESEENTGVNSEDKVQMNGTTIELNLSDFEKNTVAQNAPIQDEVKKDSARGFKKILNIVNEVGIGDLRKAKDELFALNAKKNRNEDSE